MGMSWHDLETLQGTSENTDTELFHLSVKKQRPQFTLTCPRVTVVNGCGSESSHPSPSRRAGGQHTRPSNSCCLFVSALPLLGLDQALAKREPGPLLPVHLPLPPHPIATASGIGQLQPHPRNQRFYSAAPFSASQCPSSGFCSPEVWEMHKPN